MLLLLLNTQKLKNQLIL